MIATIALIFGGVIALVLLGVYWGEFSRWESKLEQKDRHYR